MAGRVDPVWWSRNPSLAETIDSELAKPAHRERWKYTRPAKVIDLLSTSAAAPPNSDLPELFDLQAQLKQAPEALAPFTYAQALEVVRLNDGDVLDLDTIDHPVLIVVEPAACVTVQRHATAHPGYFTWIQALAQSQLTVAINALDGQSVWDYLNIQLHAHSRAEVNLHHLGADLARQDIQIYCREPGAEVVLNSAAGVLPGHHLDQQITVEHRASQTLSHQRIHSTAGANAKVTFNGRIHIHKDCPQVRAELVNKNLALAESASINTKPELEIYTDDVTCSHGATVGALDPAELFYCAARGIGPEQAKTMLSLAFLHQASVGPLKEIALEALPRAII